MLATEGGGAAACQSEHCLVPGRQVRSARSVVLTIDNSRPVADVTVDVTSIQLRFSGEFIAVRIVGAEA